MAGVETRLRGQVAQLRKEHNELTQLFMQIIYAHGGRYLLPNLDGDMTTHQIGFRHIPEGLIIALIPKQEGEEGGTTDEPKSRIVGPDGSPLVQG